MEADRVWRHIHAERRALRDVLQELTDDDWESPSVCTGWRIRDVAAHAIAAPQLRLRGMPAMAWRGRFNFDRMGLIDGRRRGQAPITDIISQYEIYDGSRHRMPGTLPLPDILVHFQDVVRALDRTHDMPVDAAAEAADQTRKVAGMLGARKLVNSVRMQATDIEWTRGRGPTIAGPMQELLLVCSGRIRVARDLNGDGLQLAQA